MSLTEEQIKTALAAAVDPNTGKDFVAGKSLKNIKFDGSDVSFDIELGYPAKTQFDVIRQQVPGEPVCYFNGEEYKHGAYVVSGSELLQCSYGVDT